MSKKILVVDDEPDLIRVTTFRLKKMGYNVITGINGQEAITLIQNERPDLVLLDLRLPIFGGLEVCKKVKADEKLKNIPIVLFTASTGSIEKTAKEAGADGYLIKPFSQEELDSELAKFLG